MVGAERGRETAKLSAYFTFSHNVLNFACRLLHFVIVYHCMGEDVGVWKEEREGAR